MNNELLLSIKKDTDTLIEQIKTRPQETLEVKRNVQMETSSFSPRISLIGESKWLLAMTFFEATNSVFIIADESISFSITIPGIGEPNPMKKLLTN